MLANMAAVECCCSEIIDNHGIELLVQFLHEAPVEGSRKCELATVERVQQKAAIALTRLCRDTEVAQTVVDLNGTKRSVPSSLSESLDLRYNVLDIPSGRFIRLGEER